MIRASTDDLDYLVTRLHARRSRMIEGARLDPVCGLRTIPELGRALYRETDFSSAEILQRRLVQDLIQEVVHFRKHVSDTGQEFISWLLVRFQVENMKTLLRGLLSQTPLDRLQPHLAVLPGDLALAANSLLNSGSAGDFAAGLPRGKPRARMSEMLARQPEDALPFLLEAALDCGYHQELLARTAELPDEEREIILPLIFQEANFFQLMLVVRGKFHHELAERSLSPLRVPGSGVSGGWFNLLLAAPDPPAAVKLGLGIVLDELPANHDSSVKATILDAATMEALSGNRLLRLANGAFRRSHMGLGAVAGYVVLRRMEVANLITLSDGIRLGMDSGTIRSRMVPRTELEAAHV